MSAPPPSTVRQSDVRRRNNLTTTLSAPTSSDPDADLNSEQYLDKLEEDFNKKIDGDVESLTEGMVELIKLQKTEEKDHFKSTQDAFQMEIRTESMIKSAHSLLSLCHSLKLLHLFNDVNTPSQVRDRLAAQYEEEISKLKLELGM